MKNKRGLAVFYDPHNVYQFLWYYCTYGQDMDWDALCLPNSFQGEYVSEWAEKLGIFKNIYRLNYLANTNCFCNNCCTHPAKYTTKYMLHQQAKVTHSNANFGKQH